MREPRKRFHGPYPRHGKWRVIVVNPHPVGDERPRAVESFTDEETALRWIADAQSALGKLAAERTISEAVEAYFVAQDRRVTEGELRPSTVERDRYHLRSQLKLAKHGQLELRRLTPELAKRLYDARVGAVDTHRNGLAVARAFGAWCVDQRLIRANPFSGVKGRGRRRKGKPQLRIDEARRFQSACLELAPRDDGAVLSLAYLLLGARAGEIVLREARDVDDAGRLLWIPDSKTQAGRRQLGVPEQLAPHLHRLAAARPASALLFAHAEHRVRPQDWAREQVTRLCRIAGVPRVTPQGLRGTLATMGREVGNTSQQVADLLGHASPAITEGGAYVDGGRAAAAARRVGWRVLDGGGDPGDL